MEFFSIKNSVLLCQKTKLCANGSAIYDYFLPFTLIHFVSILKILLRLWIGQKNSYSANFICILA